MSKAYSYVACSRKSKNCSCPVVSALLSAENEIEAYEISDDYGNIVKFSVSEMSGLSRANGTLDEDSDKIISVSGAEGTIQLTEEEFSLILGKVREDGLFGN